MTSAGAARERILLATAALLLGLFAILSVVPPLLSEAGRRLGWLWILYGIVLLIPVALLIPAVIRPRSLIASLVAALAVGVLLILGMSAQPMSLPRIAMHLAAILCLAALGSRVIYGVAGRRYKVLWIAPSLLLGFAIAYVAGGMIRLHMVVQVCNWLPLGREISSILCSG
ncbi:MAG: hypothetical protein E6I37_16595 [Chloroflexi bacterium]|nr:MAG: hypothetical protein E6I37_16595 [Chloroflexota bacterium]